jgi:hypothetical protein
MRTKDLKVGMEVAVNRAGIIHRAFILEVGTLYTWAKHGPYGLSFALPPLLDSTPPRNAIAIAWTSKHWAQWQPDVVRLAQIVSTWVDYEAGLAKKQEKLDTDKEQERLRLARLERKCAECKEILGIDVESGCSVGFVAVPLAQLYQFAIEFKQLRESLQKLQREHFCDKGDKPCGEIPLKPSV